jgi:hypothetical protein
MLLKNKKTGKKYKVVKKTTPKTKKKMKERKYTKNIA